MGPMGDTVSTDLDILRTELEGALKRHISAEFKALRASLGGGGGGSGRRAPPMDGDEFDGQRAYTVTEVCAVLGLSRPTVYTAVKVGKLRPIEQPSGVRALRFRGDALNAWRRG